MPGHPYLPSVSSLSVHASTRSKASLALDATAVGRMSPQTCLPDSLGHIERLEEPGGPDRKPTNRGPATGQRPAIPALTLHK